MFIRVVLLIATLLVVNLYSLERIDELSYKVPNEWVKSSLSKNNLFYFVPKERPQEAYILITERYKANGVSLLKESKKWVEIVSKKFDNEIIMPLQEFHIDGNLGYYTTMSVSFDEKEVQVYYYIMSFKNKIYLVTTFCYSDVMEAYLPVFEEFVDSLKFIGKD